MSVVTGRNGLKITIPDGNTAGEYTNYTRTYNPDVTMTQTVDGFVATLKTTARLAGGAWSLNWNGQEFFSAQDHGTGLQWCYQCTPYAVDGAAFSINNNSGIFFAPCEEGNQADGNSQHVCSSDLLETWVRNDNLGIITTVIPAAWGGPADVTAPIPYNPRRLVRFTTTAERIFGYNGNFHIIQSINQIGYPPDSELTQFDWIQLCDMTIYMPITPFSVCRKVNPATGATVVATPGGAGVIEYNTTQPYLWEDAGGTFACGVYTPPSKIGPLGFYCARFGPVNCNTFAFRCPAQQVGGVKANPETARAFLCWGTRADVVAAFQQLYIDFP